MCVVARTNPILEDYKKALENAGIKTYEIRRSKTDDRGMPGVRLATMHRVKGLEFSCMFLVGMNKGNMPLKKAIETTDEEARKEAIIAERSLLYVALTRAKKISYVSGYGKMSEFVMA
ncbi:MAG: ATP-binding domain-containing protein [Oscillospiraceae bacterium]|nr:ATP-binding domain-containing protein [Oscillospiraceae bacterium]